MMQDELCQDALQLLDDVPEGYRESATQVADYLIAVRGGALFLSGADIRLLVQWLDDAVPVPAILCAIDKVSIKRREKRVQTRMSLNVCKATLRKVLYKNAPKEKNATMIDGVGVEDMIQQSNVEYPGLLVWAQRIENSITTTSLFYQAQEKFAKQIKKMAYESVSRTQISDKIIEMITGFLQIAWQEYGEKQTHWIEQAEDELDALRSLLPQARWNEAVEEVRRDRLRSMFPLFSAQIMWDILNGVFV